MGSCVNEETLHRACVSVVGGDFNVIPVLLEKCGLTETNAVCYYTVTIVVNQVFTRGRLTACIGQKSLK